jgi:hypothetical protein
MGEIGVLNVVAVCGLLGVVIEVAAAWSNKRSLQRASGWRGRRLSVSAAIAGLLLAIASFFTGYPLGDVRVAGVPFVAVVFKFERGHWIDYIGPFVGLAMLGNIVFAALLPQVLVFVVRTIAKHPDAK